MTLNQTITTNDAATVCGLLQCYAPSLFFRCAHVQGDDIVAFASLLLDHSAYRLLSFNPTTWLDGRSSNVSLTTSGGTLPQVGMIDLEQELAPDKPSHNGNTSCFRRRGLTLTSRSQVDVHVEDHSINYYSKVPNFSQAKRREVKGHPRKVLLGAHLPLITAQTSRQTS